MGEVPKYDISAARLFATFCNIQKNLLKVKNKPGTRGLSSNGIQEHYADRLVIQ